MTGQLVLVLVQLITAQEQSTSQLSLADKGVQDLLGPLITPDISPGQAEHPALHLTVEVTDEGHTSVSFHLLNHNALLRLTVTQEKEVTRAQPGNGAGSFASVLVQPTNHAFLRELPQPKVVDDENVAQEAVLRKGIADTDQALGGKDHFTAHDFELIAA